MSLVGGVALNIASPLPPQLQSSSQVSAGLRQVIIPMNK